MGEVAQIDQTPTPEELAPEEQPGPQFKGERAQKRIRQLLAEVRVLRLQLEMPLFDEDQQKAFNKAFASRERKIRNEYDRKLSATVADLLETVTLAYELLRKCGDKISRPDARAIELGLLELTNEYGNN